MTEAATEVYVARCCTLGFSRECARLGRVAARIGVREASTRGCGVAEGMLAGVIGLKEPQRLGGERRLPAGRKRPSVGQSGEGWER